MKILPFDRDFINKLACDYPTPFYLYSEEILRANVRRLQQAFKWADGFKEYFAVKANPNPWILQILQEEGCGADCSSGPELMIANQVGISGREIMFTSNNTPAQEYRLASEMGAIINFDDLTHLDFYQREVGHLPELVCFRYNPGKLKQGNEIIGNPEQAKYGLTREQLFEAYAQARKLGARKFGLHTMVASNELNPQYFVETARILFDLMQEISVKLDLEFEFVNLGGGIGIPYHPDQQAVDLDLVGKGIQTAYNQVFQGGRPPKIFMEMGRLIAGPAGWLITRAIHQKHIYKEYIGVDACMANLMRPALYGAYHHITVMGKEGQSLDHLYDIVGSLCENNDKFAIDRQLPKVEIGDLLVMHDAGAHGYAMGFNYNGKLRCAELLWRSDGDIQLIRRAETFEDYMATIDF